MKEKLMKRIADQYIDSYNKFDLEGMTRNLHRDIVFKNINDGEVTVELYGKPAFKTQIEQAFGFIFISLFLNNPNVCSI